MTPIIITTAITGALPRKKDNPAAHYSARADRIDTPTRRAPHSFTSMRDKDENPSSDPDLFARVQRGKHCPGMIIQFSTGGRGRKPQERGASLYLKPDMASLTTGSVNFPNQIYENPPDFIESLCRSMLEFGVKPEIEVFDAAMLYNSAELVKRGLIKRPLHVQFVMGIPNAMPARRTLLEFLVGEMKEILPDATWSALGMARNQPGQQVVLGMGVYAHRHGERAHRQGLYWQSVMPVVTPSWRPRWSMAAARQPRTGASDSAAQ
jgi:uncharacterized protein (DUF849 family)